MSGPDQDESVHVTYARHRSSESHSMTEQASHLVGPVAGPERNLPAMDVNAVTLAFKNGLERAFQQDYFDSSIGLLRTSFILGMVYYAAFSILDRVVLTEVSPRLITIRFLFVVPPVLTIFVLSFTEGFRRWWQVGAGIATVVSGTGIVAMTVIPEPLARSHYYAGIMLVLIYCYLLIRLRFIWASVAGWIIVAFYILSVFVYPGPDSDVVTVNLFFLVSANVLGMFGGYALEYYTRRDFYYRHLLRAEHAKVEEANDRLEERVRENTKELRQDIRRRKEVETALRRSEQKHRLLAENTLDVIWQMNLSLVFTYVNPAIREIAGFSPAEWIGSSLEDHCSAQALRQMTSIIQGELAHPEDHTGVVFETTFLHAQGHEFPVDVHGKILFDEDQTPVGFQGTTRDITERKKREEELRAYREQLEMLVDERTQKLHDAQAQLVRQERLAVLGELAGAVAHELRNPLGAISNGTFFLDMVFQNDELEPEVGETLEILNREVLRSERIIKGLLDYAEAGPPIHGEIDLNALMEAVLSQQTLPDRVALTMDLDKSLPTILADREQIVRAVDNLIRNALQAMPDGGRLTVTTDQLSMKRKLRSACGDDGSATVDDGPRPTDSWILLTVSDTGEGIREENLERIFEPLFSTRTHGIGLGLALTKQLVEGHGGTIDVESRAEEGSTFTVALPVNGGAEEAPRRGRNA